MQVRCLFIILPILLERHTTLYCYSLFCCITISVHQDSCLIYINFSLQISMKVASGIALVSAAALSSAQVIKNGNGTYTCALASGAYCASSSLESNIIIRCTNGIGYASNCDERLSDKAPLGTSYSPCWQTSVISANAQCSKNGMIYPDGNNTTPYPVPNYQIISARISSAATASAESTRWPYNSNFTTTTTTSTSTNTRTTTLHLTVESAEAYSNSSVPYYGNASANGNIADADPATSSSTSAMPYLPYFPAVILPTSTTYLADIIYSYTTVCPAGATITDSAGAEAVLATPSTITLTTTSRSSITVTAVIVTSLSSPIFAFDSTSTVAVAVAVASPAYLWGNPTWSNATTLAVIATVASVTNLASPSASASATHNANMLTPYTGVSAGRPGVSLAAALIVLMALL
jgi:hypothetical protein